MIRNHRKISRANLLTCFVVFTNAIVLEQGFLTNAGFYWLLLITIPALVLALLQRARG